MKSDAPFKTRDQARLAFSNKRRWLLRCHNDLTVSCVQGVERVKKLFLSGIFSSKNMHIIDKKNIRASICCTEKLHFSIANRTYKVFCECFDSKIECLEPSFLKGLFQCH